MSRFPKPLRVAWRLVATLVPLAVGLIALVLVIAWLAGTFETKIAPGRTNADVATLTDQPTEVVHEVTKSYIEEAVGTLKAASRTVISARVLARIEEITVVAGDQVDEGDLLVRLDDMQLKAKLSQAEQALLGAIANRTEAETYYKRMKQLVERNAVARSDYDEATRRSQVARSEVSRSEQAVAEAKVMLAYTVIKAPSRSFLVKASLPRSDDLYEGMFGRLLIPAGTRRHLCLATDAIQTVGQLEMVDVVLPDDRLERRFIKTGRLGMPGKIEVLSGLKAGERVVLQQPSQPQPPVVEDSGDANTAPRSRDR